MALHKDFPDSPHAILDPDIRWFPAAEALRETSMEKLMPPLVSQLQYIDRASQPDLQVLFQHGGLE